MTSVEATHGYSTRERSKVEKEIDAVDAKLLVLRQACCHPQLGSRGVQSGRRLGDSSAGSHFMSMDAILGRLLETARTHCEEAQRKQLMALCGLAGVARIYASQLSSAKNDIAMGTDGCQINLKGIKLKDGTPCTTSGDFLKLAMSAYLEAVSVFECHRMQCPLIGEAEIRGSYLIIAEANVGVSIQMANDLKLRWEYTLQRPIVQIIYDAIKDMTITEQQDGVNLKRKDRGDGSNCHKDIVKKRIIAHGGKIDADVNDSSVGTTSQESNQRNEISDDVKGDQTSVSDSSTLSLIEKNVIILELSSSSLSKSSNLLENSVVLDARLQLSSKRSITGGKIALDATLYRQMIQHMLSSEDQWNRNIVAFPKRVTIQAGAGGLFTDMFTAEIPLPSLCWIDTLWKHTDVPSSSVNQDEWHEINIVNNDDNNNDRDRDSPELKSLGSPTWMRSRTWRIMIDSFHPMFVIRKCDSIEDLRNSETHQCDMKVFLRVQLQEAEFEVDPLQVRNITTLCDSAFMADNTHRRNIIFPGISAA